MPNDKLPSRRGVESALRQAGLSHRQARKFVAAGWRALQSEAECETAELRERLADLERLLHPDGESDENSPSLSFRDER